MHGMHMHMLSLSEPSPVLLFVAHAMLQAATRLEASQPFADPVEPC